MVSRAVVVGGGIGGLAVAGGLVRAGWQAIVVERAEAFSPVGAGITVAPNGVKALDWLGLGARLRERATASGAAGVRTAKGRWLLRTEVEAVRRRFGVPAFALHRADLHRLLLDGAAGAELRT
ncbi:MAG TPA: FAD-dependent monooxygenase, partial [Pseudonocardiaceae bacterium]|nr:FAD-dependent monooxygenase [Pseudonocardiaceae bacterium]